MRGSYNPLVEAVDAYEKSLDIEGGVMFEIAGEAAFEPFDQALCDAVINRIGTAADAVRQLSPRARHARLNIIWRDFLREQQQARAEREASLYSRTGDVLLERRPETNPQEHGEASANKRVLLHTGGGEEPGKFIMISLLHPLSKGDSLEVLNAVLGTLGELGYINPPEIGKTISMVCGDCAKNVALGIEIPDENSSSAVEPMFECLSLTDYGDDQQLGKNKT